MHWLSSKFAKCFGLCCLLFLSGPLYAHETAGSVLRVALPLSAWGLTQLAQDEEGAQQFYWSFASTVATTYALKTLINKERPDGSGNDSFPSGHSAMAFHGASFIHQRYGWQYGAAAYAAATYVGWTRIHSDKHDLKDVAAGALIGVLASTVFVTENKNVQWLPLLEKERVGLQVVGHW